MKFKLKCDSYTDKNDFRINFSVWDKDLLSYNDYLSDKTIEIWDTVKTAISNDSRAKYIGLDDRGSNNEIFVVETIPNQNINFSKPSKIFVSIDVVPEEEAKLAPVGFGRADPNQDPYLPPPEGRFKLSWNPWTLFVNYY